MDKQGFRGIAHTGALNLGVHDDPLGHAQIRGIVYVNVAVPVKVLHHGHSSLGRHSTDQALTAARNGQVDSVGHAQQMPDRIAVGGLNKLNGMLWKTRLDQGINQPCIDGAIGMKGFFPTSKDNGVSTFHAECSGIHGHIGAALIDEEDHSQRHTHLLNFQAVGSPARLNDFANRVGQGPNPLNGVGKIIEPLFIEFQPINGGRRESVPRRSSQISRIGGQNFITAGRQMSDSTNQPAVFSFTPNRCQLTACRSGIVGKRAAFGVKGAFVRRGSNRHQDLSDQPTRVSQIRIASSMGPGS